MSGQVEVGSGGGNPQANEQNISQTVMDQFLSNGIMQMSSSPTTSSGVASAVTAPSMRGRDYNLPPPGCDLDTIKLFVGSIPPKYSQELLRPYFAQVGEVVEISVLEGRGSGFVWYKSREEAERAIRELDGKKPGIDPKEEHRPLEIRQARLKNDPYGSSQGGNMAQLMSLMGLMQPAMTPNFQGMFSNMGNNPNLIIQFIDLMLQQHQQQTQFLQQIRDTMCKMHNVGGSPSPAPTNGHTPFGTVPPAAPGLSAFGINNNSSNNIRRSVDNHISWNKEPVNSPANSKRASLDISAFQGNNMLNGQRINNANNNANPSLALMNMLLGQNNNASNDFASLSALMNGLTTNGNSFPQFPGSMGFPANGGVGGLEALLQAQNGGMGDMAKVQSMLHSMSGQPGGMNGVDPNNLLAAVFAQNLQNSMSSTNTSSPLSMANVGMVSNGMVDTNSVVWNEGLSRRSMESVPENGSRGEQGGVYKEGGEGLLRQILEESVSTEGGQENSIPTSTMGYESWGGQPTSGQC
eukprot:TRINITY_DN1297_c0_g2_i1.p1 TRINITY_DN1297_c0_g2~~TRINITY_DN1297_c0_g2_i1.p1  ORF type:complete len:522 (+),score=105.71 TRINITY_DN1297_c0_g2_i1:168-1733(+)